MIYKNKRTIIIYTRGKNKKKGARTKMMNTSKEGAYYSLKKVAELSGASYGTVKRDIDNGRLSAYRIGRKYFVAQETAQYYRDHVRSNQQVKGYTIQQLMAKIPLSYAFLMDLIKTKKLVAVKVGRQYIIPYEVFHAFMEENKIEA